MHNQYNQYIEIVLKTNNNSNEDTLQSLESLIFLIPDSEERKLLSRDMSHGFLQMPDVWCQQIFESELHFAFRLRKYKLKALQGRLFREVNDRRRSVPEYTRVNEFLIIMVIKLGSIYLTIDDKVFDIYGHQTEIYISYGYFLIF